MGSRTCERPMQSRFEVATGRPTRHTAAMDQERADYADHTSRPKHPWTILEKAILFLIVVGSIPVLSFIFIAVLVIGYVAIYGKVGK
jgi:hypothetical protein